MKRPFKKKWHIKLEYGCDIVFIKAPKFTFFVSLFWLFVKTLFFSLKDLRQNVQTDDSKKKQQEFEAGPKASEGYGGKFGVMNDRMDKVSH